MSFERELSRIAEREAAAYRRRMQEKFLDCAIGLMLTECSVAHVKTYLRAQADHLDGFG